MSIPAASTAPITTTTTTTTTSVPPAPPAHLFTISFSALTSSDPAIHAAEIARLLNVCETSGFFYLSDHAVPSDLLRRAIAATRSFFLLPEHIKLQYDHSKQCVQPPTSRGYAAAELVNNNQGVDKKELFDLGVDGQYVEGKRFTGPNILPPDNVAPDFAKSLLELQDLVMEQLVPVIIRAFGEALGLGPEFFVPYMREPMLSQRVLYYPPRLGTAGKHTDTGLFTILMQEPSLKRSLQVFTGGNWVAVDAREDLFVVNLGDTLQYWTEGRFVSTPHQVKHCGDDSRVALPFFLYPDVDAEFKTLGQRKLLKAIEIMDENWDSIWVTKTGAGRSRELV